MRASTKLHALLALLSAIGLVLLAGCGESGGVGPSGGGADTLFVSIETGDDLTGDGSRGAPYRTITKALSESSPGETVMALAGIYSSQVGETLPLVTQLNVAIVGEHPTTTVLRLEAGETGIAASDSCYIGKLSIRGGARSEGTGILVTGVRIGLQGCRIETLGVGVAAAARQGCVVDLLDLEFASCTSGVSFQGPTTFVINGSSFSDCDTAMVFASTSFGRAESNVLEDCDHGIWDTSHGVIAVEDNDFSTCQVGVGALGVTALEVVGNEMDTVETGIDVGTGSNVRITGNGLTGGGQGIVVRGTAIAVIDSNTVDSMRTVGILFEGGSAIDITRDLLHNTVSACAHGIHFSGTASALVEGNDVMNNLGHGIWITESANPDLGGGMHGSVGGNAVVGNGLWDVFHETPSLIKAEGNTWDHSTPGDIDAIDIYDDDENPQSGAVDFEPFVS